VVLAEEKTRTLRSLILKALGARPAQVRETHCWPSLPGWACWQALVAADGSAFATPAAFRGASASAALAWDARRSLRRAVLLGVLTRLGPGGPRARVPFGASRRHLRTNSHNRSLIQSTPSPSPGYPHPPVDILRGIDLDIPSAICGHHGTLRRRKTTAARFAGGPGLAHQRRVLLDGEDITKPLEDQMAVLRGRKIVFVYPVVSTSSRR